MFFYLETFHFLSFLFQPQFQSLVQSHFMSVRMFTYKAYLVCINVAYFIFSIIYVPIVFFLYIYISRSMIFIIFSISIFLKCLTPISNLAFIFLDGCFTLKSECAWMCCKIMHNAKWFSLFIIYYEFAWNIILL